MMASTLIKQLQEMVNKFGDQEVWVCHNDYSLRLPLTGTGYIEGEDFDLFVKGLLPDRDSMT